MAAIEMYPLGARRQSRRSSHRVGQPMGHRQHRGQNMMQIIEITEQTEQSFADALACPETRTAIDVFESIERALYLPPSILSRRALHALQKRFETIAGRLERRHQHDLT